MGTMANSAEKQSMALIGEKYPQYALRKLKQRLDYLHFSILILQRMGVSRKDAIAITAPIRKSFGKILECLSDNLEDRLELFGKIKPDVTYYEISDKRKEEDLIKTKYLIGKEKGNIEEIGSIDPAFALDVSRFLEIYEIYCMILLEHSIGFRIDSNEKDILSSESFKKLLEKLVANAKRKKSGLMITSQKHARLYKPVLKKEGFEVRSCLFKGAEDIKKNEDKLKKMISISWLKKKASKKGIDPEKFEQEHARIVRYFGISRR